MSEQKDAGMPTPPYVAYRTFATFLEEMRQGIPNQLDRTAFPTMSGGVYNQLMPALRYLKLVQAERATELLFELVGAVEEDEKREVLLRVLKGGYPYLLEDPGFDLQFATAKQLSDRFRENGAAGDTVRKCEGFFLSAAREAGVSLGRWLQRPPRSSDKKASASTRTSRNKKLRGTAKRDRATASAEDDTGPTAIVLKELMGKLPTFDPSWPPQTQANYLAFAEKVMKYARQEGAGAPFQGEESEESEEPTE